jgi:GntR family transcriptional regulator
VERFRVSRVTVRRALRELEEEGLVLAAPGRGWLVREGRLEEPETELLPFSAAASARGLRATSEVLVARSREASFEEAEALAVAPGSTVFELERVRLLDGLPVAIDWCLLGGGGGGDLERRDWRSASLYEALAAAGSAPVRADYVVRADGADAREARHLDLAAGAPVLRADQASFDASGRPVQLCRIAYRGDRYRFRASLGRRP